jgi:putative protease
MEIRKPELLAPAGNLEKLKMAIIYGADAVYIGGEQYSLRVAADNFSIDDIKKGIEFAHSRGKKVYITANIIPHNEDIEAMPEFIRSVSALGVDGLIVADPGVLTIAKEVAPEIKIHLSTQANNTNWKSASFWYENGVERIVLARELSLKEVKEIRNKTSNNLELELFVHGAMCISYSGRCLLSNYMAQRDANRGECAHPCRWKYYLMEEKRQGEYMPVYENDRGTFIYNSKDLCMIAHIPDIINSGVSSFKIEGRVKSAYYVATIVKAYRQEIDRYMDDPDNYKFDASLLEEVAKVSHREYTTGFYFGKPTGEDRIYKTSSYTREYEIVGMVKEYYPKQGIVLIEQRNRFYTGDEVEFVPPKGDYFKHTITQMTNDEGESIDVAPHPQMLIKTPLDTPVHPNTLIRKKK